MLIYHIHHYQTFKFALQKSFFWSMLTKFVLTVFICSERWVSYMISLAAGKAGQWDVLVLILLTLRVSIVSRGVNIITVISVFSNQYEVLETNSSFEINNKARELCRNNSQISFDSWWCRWWNSCDILLLRYPTPQWFNRKKSNHKYNK